jgi:hypothetical protein
MRIMFTKICERFIGVALIMKKIGLAFGLFDEVTHRRYFGYGVW